MNYKKTRVIVCAVIEKNNSLLFGRKKEKMGPYPNAWHLLGGGVNDGESLNDAIRREIKEESGIEVKITRSLGFAEDLEPNKSGKTTHYIFLTFLAKYVSGEIKADDDIKRLAWIEKEELTKIKLTKPSLRLFKEIGYLS
jgi:ADP-ribose pyrophosphatase YjhB (NUDIX family)